MDNDRDALTISEVVDMLNAALDELAAERRELLEERERLKREIAKEDERLLLGLPS